jgi:hypothetical protein
MWIEVVGWSGSFSILLAYALLSTGRMDARGWPYQAMNVGGALGMATNAWTHGALPSVFNNTIWMAIGLLALLRIGLRRRG